MTPKRPGRRRPGRLRRWVVRPTIWLFFVLLLGGALGWFLLHSDWGRERGRTFLEVRLSEALDRPVSLGGLQFGIFPLRLEGTDLVVAGPNDESQPVLILPSFEVDVSIDGIRNPRLTIDRVLANEPQFFLELGPNGHNLPIPQAGGGQRKLEWRLGALAVQNGLVHIDELTVPLDINAEELGILLEGRGPGLDLGGSIFVERLATSWPVPRDEQHPYVVRTEGKVLLNEEGLTLEDAHLWGEDLSLAVSGTMDWPQGEQSLALRLEAEGDVDLVRHLGYLDEPASGAFRYSGRLSWKPGGWFVEGDLASPQVDILGRTLGEITAAVRVDPGAARVDLAGADFGGGKVRGPIVVDLSRPDRLVSLDLKLDRLDLPTLLADQGLEVRALAGKVGGELTYQFPADQYLAGEGWARLKLLPVEGSPETVSFAGSVNLNVSSGLVQCRAARLTTAAEKLLVSGLSFNLKDGSGRVGFELEASSIARLETLIPQTTEVGTSDGIGPGGEWWPGAGSGLISGVANWDRQGVGSDLDLDLSDIESNGLILETLRGSLRLDPVGITALRLEGERSGGALLLVGRIPFSSKEEVEPFPLSLSVDASRWPSAELKPWIPDGVEIAGPLTGHLELSVQEGQPTGSALLEIEPAEVYGLEADRLMAELRLSPTVVHLDRAKIELPAGPLEGSGLIGLGSDQPIELTVDAPRLDLGIEPLADWIPGTLTGEAALSVRVEGSIESPQAHVELVAEQLEIDGQPVEPTRFTADWVNGQVEVDGQVLGFVTARGGGLLDRERAEVEIAVKGSDLSFLAKLSGQPSLEDLTGSFAGSLQVTGPLADPTVSLTMPSLTFKHSGLQLQALEPVTAQMTGQVVALDSFYVGDSAGSEVFLFGTLDPSRESPLDLRFQATGPAAWLKVLRPDLRIRGTLSALGKVVGDLDRPVIDGLADLQQGHVILPDFPHSFENVLARVLMDRDQLVLDEFRARLAGGTLRAGGRMPLAGQGADYRFWVESLGARLRYPEGWIIEADSSLSVVPAADGGRLIQGVVDLKRAAYVENVDVSLISLINGFLRRQRFEVGSADPLLVGTELNVAVDAREGTLRVKNNVADLLGKGDLVVRGTLARPVLIGDVELKSGGTLTYNGSTYEVERGLLTFSRLDRISPFIDLVARNRIRTYDITLNLSGSIEKLNADFSSEPPLPDLNVLALVASGDNIDIPGNSSAAGSSSGSDEANNQGAQTFLAEQAVSALNRRVKSLFGFDTFRINPTATSGGSISSARFTVGKQISRDLYVTYSRDPAANENEIVQVEWQIEPDLVLLFTSTDGDEFAVDLRWDVQF